MHNVFEEPRKFTLRGQIKAAFSGSSRAIVALKVPRGTTDSFQDGANVSKLNYNIDYSTMGTQSCNGRIPSMGLTTIYLGFENERMRYSNYLWVEAIASVPNTEYFKAQYNVSRSQE